MGHIPEDRQVRGLVLDFSLAENLALHDFRTPPESRFGWLFPRRLVERARSLLREFDVRGGGPETPAASLSGGNQQKVVIAREVSRNPRVLVAAQPTRGLDVGAIEFVHRRLVAGARRGASDPSDLLRARGDPLTGRPDLRPLRGPVRLGVSTDRVGGGARLRHDRRAARRGGLNGLRAAHVDGRGRHRVVLHPPGRHHHAAGSHRPRLPDRWPRRADHRATTR